MKTKYVIYNSYTNETYSEVNSVEEALDLQYCIEDELKTEHMPFSDCVSVAKIGPGGKWEDIDTD